jgi:hypothetical protein
MPAGGFEQRARFVLVAAVAAAAALATSAHARQDPCAAFFEQASSSTPSPEASPLDPTVTASYAVLRRPAGPQDQIPLFNSLREDIGDQLRSYFPAYIRELSRDAEGDRYFLIPGLERAAFVPPAKCAPAADRHLLIKLAEEQRKRASVPLYCIEDLAPRRIFEYPSVRCQAFAAVASGARLVELAESRSDVTELAPDGVASVRLIYRARNLITAPVSNNSFTFTPPQRLIKEVRRRVRPLERQLIKELGTKHRHALRHLARLIRKIRDRVPPQTVQWVGASGQIIASFRPKPAASALFGGGSPRGEGEFIATTIGSG